MLADTINHVYAKKLYNDQGYILEISSSYSTPDNLVKQSEYIYNEERLEKIILYGQDSKEFSTMLFKYDKKGNQVESDLTPSKSAHKQTSVFKYDRNNRVIKETIHYYYEEKEYKKTEAKNKYDKRDNIIKTRDTEYTDKSEKEEYVFSYVYDESGNMIELSIYTPEDKSEYKCISEYNEHGDMLKETCYDDGTTDGETEVNLYRYKYDNHNNWIKKDHYFVVGDNEKLKNVDIREFKYYD